MAEYRQIFFEECLFRHSGKYLIDFIIAKDKTVLVQVSHISQRSFAYTLMSDSANSRGREACIQDASG